MSLPKPYFDDGNGIVIYHGDCRNILPHLPKVDLVLLDPPYADTAGRRENLYAQDSTSVAHAVREWAIANGDNPLLRIALCGYEGEHVMPDSWGVVHWNAGEGYGAQSQERTGNGKRERVWFSPHCLTNDQGWVQVDLYGDGMRREEMA